MIDSTYRITLVHGTFARGAPWTKEGSRLSSSLRTALGANATVEPCEWSGGNSAADREDGAARLAEHLRGQGDKAAKERRFVVAHSHGGNVALYALRDPEVERLVDGVVCMATPFIVARRRDLGSKGPANILAVFVLAALAFWFFVLEGLLEVYVGEIGALVALLFYLTFVGGALVSLYKGWSGLADRLIEALRLAELPSSKLLIVRETGDEASALLLFFQFVSQLAVRVFHILQATYFAIERRFETWSKQKLRLAGVCAGGFALLIATITTLLWLGAAVYATAIATLVVAFVGVVVPGLLLIGAVKTAAAIFRFFATLALVPAAIALAVCMVPIDWRVALANLLVDVTVETAPPGRWTTLQLVPSPVEAGEGDQGKTPGFAHSVVYDDEQAIRAIVDWIKDRTRLQSAGGGEQPRESV